MRKDTERLKLIFDGLESVRGAIDDVLAIQERQFSPYDEIIGTMETLFSYAGEMQDENELVYLRARYYSHSLGRFISQDPYEGSSDDPTSLNGYAYADNNPVNKTDPSGLLVCSDISIQSDPARWLRCAGQVGSLNHEFGIRLTEEAALSYDLSNWISPRVNNVYAAVQAINARLGGLTRQAIGDTEIRLLAQGSGTEAAATTRCDLLSLYLNFDGASDHVHSVDNLIHEFGHVVTLSPPIGRTTNSEALGPANDMQNRPVALWAQVRNYRGFNVEDGWDIRQRESKSSDPAEVVPDMFLYWVQGYPFTEDDNNFGQARSAFMNGGDIPANNGRPLTRINDNTAINDGSVIRSAGITSWARNASCAGAAGAGTSETGLANYPDLVAINNGWCNL